MRHLTGTHCEGLPPCYAMELGDLITPVPSCYCLLFPFYLYFDHTPVDPPASEVLRRGHTHLNKDADLPGSRHPYVREADPMSDSKFGDSMELSRRDTLW